jgi:hypothetical protein
MRVDDLAGADLPSLDFMKAPAAHYHAAVRGHADLPHVARPFESRSTEANTSRFVRPRLPQSPR